MSYVTFTHNIKEKEQQILNYTVHMNDHFSVKTTK
jgi:hypothetical protein